MGRNQAETRYAFIVDWYDTTASMTRSYQLIYYNSDKSVEMFDVKNRRTFLKRCDYPSVTLDQLHIDSKVTIYSRQLTVKGYADQATSDFFYKKMQMTVGYVLNQELANLGKIIGAAIATGLAILEMRMLTLSPEQANALGNAALSRGPVVAMKLTKEDCKEAWAAVANGNPAIIGSDSKAAADQQAAFLFGGGCQLPKPQDIERSSLLLVRPHAMSTLGSILDKVVVSGFEVVGAQMLQLTRPNAQEFLEVYRGVVPEYTEWVSELVSGQCVALQVKFLAQPENTVPALRELCGAHDPEVAAYLHVGSLRQEFGETKVKNAVHCTDLPEDGPLEVDYFFNILPAAA